MTIVNLTTIKNHKELPDGLLHFSIVTLQEALQIAEQYSGAWFYPHSNPKVELGSLYVFQSEFEEKNQKVKS